MAKRKAKAATTVKKVSRGMQKMRRQAVKNVKAVATKARRTGKVAKKAAGKASRRAKTSAVKAAEAIGSALGKAVGTVERIKKVLG